MKVFNRLKIQADEQTDRAHYQEEYWALRKRYNIKDGKTLEPLSDQQKEIFRKQVQKLKKRYHQD